MTRCTCPPEDDVFTAGCPVHDANFDQPTHTGTATLDALTAIADTGWRYRDGTNPHRIDAFTAVREMEGLARAAIRDLEQEEPTRE